MLFSRRRKKSSKTRIRSQHMHFSACPVDRRCQQSARESTRREWTKICFCWKLRPKFQVWICFHGPRLFQFFHIQCSQSVVRYRVGIVFEWFSFAIVDVCIITRGRRAISVTTLLHACEHTKSTSKVLIVSCCQWWWCCVVGGMFHST